MNHNFEYKASGNIVFYPKKYSNKSNNSKNLDIKINDIITPFHVFLFIIIIILITIFILIK